MCLNNTKVWPSVRRGLIPDTDLLDLMFSLDLSSKRVAQRAVTVWANAGGKQGGGLVFSLAAGPGRAEGGCVSRYSKVSHLLISSHR